MDEFAIVRSLVLRAVRDVAGTSALAKAVLAWATPHSRWLSGSNEPLRWRGLIAALEAERAPEPLPHPLQRARALARVLRLEEAEDRLLAVCVASDRCPRVRQLIRRLTDSNLELHTLLADAAGIDVHALRRSPVLRLELVYLKPNWMGRVEVEIGWTLERLLDRGDDSEESLIATVVGERQVARLAPHDFVGVEGKVALLTRILRGSLAQQAKGINILIHGPPGTGKTELARTLADRAGAALFSVGECDEDGSEPTRWERVNALQLAQRVLDGRNDALLLFDEMEDVIGDMRRGEGSAFTGRAGSKIFVNRMLETNAVPVIWTTNAVDNIDTAILRRMSFVLELGLPSRRAGQQMLARVAGEEGIAVDRAVTELVATAPETATILRVAARAGKLAGEDSDTADVAQALSRALRGGAITLATPGPADLDLFEADRDIGQLFGGLTASHAPRDFSLLLTGPPGTGKTALAHHLAVALDRPLLVRRASDLLSKWVGDTERLIAAAFEDAVRDDAVLFFDEADSLLFDRTTAERSWEVSQVNELLTWLDRHPLPFVAASNFAGRLDPAALRRFVFKLELRPLGRDRAVTAFQRFFGLAAPAELVEIANLTAGDFAVVKRQLRFTGDTTAMQIVAQLRAEAAAKPGQPGRLGF